MLEKRTINPWTWQDAFGYAQALEVTQASRTLYLSGQAAMSPEGVPSEADMAGQVALAMDNLEAVLAEAGYSMADVVRLNVLTTSVAELFPVYGGIVGRLVAQGCVPACTLSEVAALAFPSLKVEIEATAVK